MVCWDCGGALVEQYGLEHHYTDSPDHPTCAFCGVGMKNVDAMNEVGDSLVHYRLKLLTFPCSTFTLTTQQNLLSCPTISPPMATT